MTKQDIQTKATEIVTQYSRRDRQVLPTSTFGELCLDSLDTVEIAMSLEEEFDVEIGDEDWNDDKTVQGVVDDIAKLLGVPA